MYILHRIPVTNTVSCYFLTTRPEVRVDKSNVTLGAMHTLIALLLHVIRTCAKCKLSKRYEHIQSWLWLQWLTKKMSPLNL